VLIATLETPIQPGKLQIGPVEHLIVRGRALHVPDGSEVAIHQAGMWVRKGICYIAVQCDCEVSLEFTHTEFPVREEFGPYSALRIVDGALWAGRPPVLIARFDETISCWHIYARPAAGMNVLIIRDAT